MKKTLWLVFFFLFSLFLNGCWDRRELNDLAIVIAAGIDKGSDNMIELSVQIDVPKMVMSDQKEGGKSQTVVRTAKGLTIFDAMSKLQESVPRHIFWGQNTALVIGEALAKEGVQEQLDFILRYPDPRPRSYVFVCKGKASDVIRLVPAIERSGAAVLRKLAESKVMMSVTVKNFMEMMNNDAGDAALPWLEIVPSGKGMDKFDDFDYRMGTAIFKKGKMIGHVNDQVTKGILLLRDEMNTTSVTFVPKESKESAGVISIEITESKTELIPHVENGKWEMTARVQAKCEIAQDAAQLDLMNPKTIESLEKQLKNELSRQIELALKPVQKNMKADIFYFADTFHQQYPAQWQKVKDHWEDIFPNVKVNIEPIVTITRPGLTTDPVGIQR